MGGGGRWNDLISRTKRHTHYYEQQRRKETNWKSKQGGKCSTNIVPITLLLILTGKGITFCIS